MRWLLWSLVGVVVLALAMPALREVAPWCPLLPWALVAWAVAEGDESDTPWRALTAGLAVDAVDPASTIFYAATFLAAALIGVLLRPWLFKGATTVMGIAVAGGLLIEFADQVLGGWGARPLLDAVLAAVLAAPVAIAFAWLVAGLPPWLHPLGRRPRTAPA